MFQEVVFVIRETYCLGITLYFDFDWIRFLQPSPGQSCEPSSAAEVDACEALLKGAQDAGLTVPNFVEPAHQQKKERETKDDVFFVAGCHNDRKHAVDYD